MFAPDVFGALSAFLDLVDRLQLPCVIGGSVASSLQGLPRQTIDLDVVVELPGDRVDALVVAAAASFYVSEFAVREAVRNQRAFNLIHVETAFKIDCYIAGPDQFDRAQFDRAIAVELPGLPGRILRVASAEDVILRKLEWYRLGHEVSERQWHDVIGVLKVQGDRLDTGYLDAWAAIRGVSELLARARAAAG
ncbi:MAG: hypothetical protein IT349_14720 [Candidatus Eisenbacteria bacterium]|nr:hypothetical protein [Candidatus Eisenbacteria bacterium]